MYLEAENLKDLVKFNREELEPTILKDNSEQRMTVFAILKEQVLKTHVSPIDDVIFVIDGKIRIKVEETNYDVKKNEIFLIPANAHHSVKGLENSMFFVIRI